MYLWTPWYDPNLIVGYIIMIFVVKITELDFRIISCHLLSHQATKLGFLLIFLYFRCTKEVYEFCWIFCSNPYRKLSDLLDERIIITAQHSNWMCIFINLTAAVWRLLHRFLFKRIYFLFIYLFFLYFWSMFFYLMY